MSNTLIIHPKDISTIYCIGRNWIEHAQELSNPVPKNPLIFTKAKSTLCQLLQPIEIPQALGRCDHELEIAVLINQPLYHANDQQVKAAISHIGLGLDLTLRDRQTELKQQGHPWFAAKNFTNATPISPLLPMDDSLDLYQINFSLTVNHQQRQQGNSRDMCFSIIDFLRIASHQLPLMAGDLFLTGTPSGVAPLVHQDQLNLDFNHQLQCQTTILRP